MSIWIELVCLLANIFLVSSISVYLKCFPTSVAYLSEGITWCLPGSTQCLSCLRLSAGFDQCLSELVLTCFFLPMSVRRNLLMSVWTELTCLLASVCLMSSIGVCPKCFPLLVCQYLSSGPTWFLSEFYLKIYRCLLICFPVFLNSPAWKDLELSANLYLYLFTRICLS